MNLCSLAQHTRLVFLCKQQRHLRAYHRAVPRPIHDPLTCAGHVPTNNTTQRSVILLIEVIINKVQLTRIYATSMIFFRFMKGLTEFQEDMSTLRLAVLMELQMGQVLRDDPQKVQRQRCLQGKSNTDDSTFPQLLHNLFLLLLL